MREPPFDGKPCPMCEQKVRNISALVHNFLVRWPESKAIAKLHDLVTYHKESIVPNVPNAAVEEMLAGVKELIGTCYDMTVEDGMIKWTTSTIERIGDVVPRLKRAMWELQPITDAHFEDYRHSHNELNILRTKTGIVAIDFLPKQNYNYTVEVTDNGADIIHKECGTGLSVHDHFRTRMEADHEFYGLVWCPTCRVNAPIKQFFCFWETK